MTDKTRLLTQDEQINALDQVAEYVTAAKCNLVIRTPRGDQVFLSAIHEPSGTTGKLQVVNAFGTDFDVWRLSKSKTWGAGHTTPVCMGVSAEVAAQHVIDEYRVLKARFVTKNLRARGIKASQVSYKDVLAQVAAEGQQQ